MRLLCAVLTSLLVLIQFPLWFGDGGVLRVKELGRQLDKQKRANLDLAARNAGLEAEVKNLIEGGEAIEERARYELGMIGKDEIFVQINMPPRRNNAPLSPDAAPTRTAMAR